MRRPHLDFALLSEGRLETLDALFEMEQLSRACASTWDVEERDGTTNAGARNDGGFASILNFIKRCLGLGKPETGNQRGDSGNTKTREGLAT